MRLEQRIVVIALLIIVSRLSRARTVTQTHLAHNCNLCRVSSERPCATSVGILLAVTRIVPDSLRVIILQGTDKRLIGGTSETLRSQTVLLVL